ncbi:MAG: ArsA-related P-loop ATPase [Myxococcota bacterium]|nr:ArsA-related P-loop ATPase [Myxococcota bacterium]
MSDLKRLIEEHDVLIVVGPGGVGKTTVSAALGLEGARQDRSCLVLTVDPARRLAQSLGLEDTGAEEVRVAPGRFVEAGIKLGAGALHAQMLDSRDTWDALVERHAPTPEVARQIMDSPFYAHGSRHLSGSLEYMAMEKLYELHHEGDHELLVLDTPPAANAIDFLQAPDRLSELLDGRSLQMLLSGLRQAGRMGERLVRFQRIVLRVMSRFVGTEMFLELVEFIHSFHSMFEGFRSRAAQVKTLLRSDRVGFVVVCSADPSSMEEGLSLAHRLQEENMAVQVFLVNQALDDALAIDEPEAIGQRVNAHVTRADEAGPLLQESCEHYQRALKRQTQGLQRLRERLVDQETDPVLVPRFPEDVHDLGALATFADTVGTCMKRHERGSD